MLSLERSSGDVVVGLYDEDRQFWSMVMNFRSGLLIDLRSSYVSLGRRADSEVAVELSISFILSCFVLFFFLVCVCVF